MDLPASVAALGEQLGKTGEVVPDPALFHAPDVFAAERERIFARPWMAVDHATRLDEHGRYFRVDGGARSIVVTRDRDGGLHALRNVCIHAGYPVCDAEEGAVERLVCPYHGWEFALDGELLEPSFSSRIDRSRLRMARHRVCVRDGLILVDPSTGPDPSEEILGPDSRLGRRRKGDKAGALQHELELEIRAALCAAASGFVFRRAVRRRRPSLYRIRPAQLAPRQTARSGSAAGHPEIQREHRFSGDPDGARPRRRNHRLPGAIANDPVADALRNAGKPAAVNWSWHLDPSFFTWYWPLMSTT